MKQRLIPALLAGAMLVPVAAKADLVFGFYPGNAFSGTAPLGNLTATFHTVAPGTVTLTLSSNLAPLEFVESDGFYFNLDPAIDPFSLQFALTSYVGFSTPATQIDLARDFLRPDNDGLMDIQFEWSLSGGEKAFTEGQSQTYTITYPGLTEASFNFDSVCDPQAGCSAGAHLAAVHIGGIAAGTGTGFVGGSLSTGTPAPEPAGAAVLGAGLLGLGLLRRLKLVRGQASPRSALRRSAVAPCLTSRFTPARVPRCGDLL